MLVRGPRWGCYSSPCTLTIRQIPARGFCWFRVPVGGCYSSLCKLTDRQILARGFCWFGVPVGGMLFKPEHATNRQTSVRGFCWFGVPVGGCYSSLCKLTDRQILARGFFVGSGSPLGDAIQASARLQTDKFSRRDFLLVRGPRWGMLFKPVHAHRQTNPREGICLMQAFIKKTANHQMAGDWLFASGLISNLAAGNGAMHLKFPINQDQVGLFAGCQAAFAVIHMD